MATTEAPFRYGRIGILQVTEDDRLGRASLLACGDDLVAPQRAALLVGLGMRILDALDAIGTFLHHAARAHRHLRVLRGAFGFGEAAVVVPVEAPHLVGTVARTRVRADAAAVDHLVEAFGRMHGGMHRAAHFARRLLAVHAGHRLE